MVRYGIINRTYAIVTRPWLVRDTKTLSQPLTSKLSYSTLQRKYASCVNPNEIR